MLSIIQPITWYDCDGNVKEIPKALDDFVHGENAYSLSHLELQPTTWEVCTEYFKETLAKKNGLKKIDRENQYWCWILPLKLEGGQARLVATTSLQELHVPFPIVKGRPCILKKDAYSYNA